MRKNLKTSLSIVALVLSGLSFTHGAIAKTLVVEKFGLPGGACTKADPCPSILDALTIAGNNDKIMVGPGSYNDPLVIDIPGIKLESTGGQYVTRIRADRDPHIGTPAITILADKVSIGKKGGKGFEIRSLNAPTIVAGADATPIGCVFDMGSASFFLDYDFSTLVVVAKTRVEDNVIRTHLDSPYIDNVPLRPSSCDDTGNVVEAEYLPGLAAIGPDATIINNVFRSEGTIASDLVNISNKLLFQDNLIKYQPNTPNVVGGMSGGLWTFASSASIKGNAIYDWRDYPDNWGQGGQGIVAAGPKGKVSNNLVEGFLEGINTAFGTTIDKNVLRFVNFSGINSSADKSVKDNTVAYWGGIDPTFAGIEIYDADKGAVTGNTVTSMNGPGVSIWNGAPDASWPGGTLKKFEKNNFFNTDYDGNRCAIVINNAGTPFKMKNNFYGDPTNPLNPPEVLDYVGAIPASGQSDAICVNSNTFGGSFDTVTGIIENVTYNPTNKPNKVKALFKRNLY